MEAELMDDQDNITEAALETTPLEDAERVLMLIHLLKPTMVMAFYFNVLGQENIGKALYEVTAEEHSCHLEDAPVNWDEYDWICDEYKADQWGKAEVPGRLCDCLREILQLLRSSTNSVFQILPLWS
jgi:hypothetical protein